MSKFVIVGDTHFRSKSPTYRRDDILKTSLEKFEWVLNRAKELGAEIIHTGDLFHSPSPSDNDANNVAELLNKYNVTVYYMLCNQDFIGGSRTSFEHIKVGLYRYYKNFNLIGGSYKEFKDCILCGYDFEKKNEVCEEIDPIKDFNLKEKNKFLICVVHQMMVGDEREIVVNNKRKTISWKSVTSTADIVISGHYHPGFGVQRNNMGTYFVNVGSFCRLEYRDAERKAQIAVIEIDKDNVDIKTEDIKVDNEIFDVDKALGDKLKKEEKSQFVDALENIDTTNLSVNNVMQNLEGLSVSKELPEEVRNVLSDKVIEMCRDRLLKCQEEE